ncbi:hypothetical protein IAQ67_28860 (plasmid) [Paenibacillus peoriae]|uniref:DUF3221 domain-containing protein n=1 Tax=Paenibacillus peoriae TaxID=59893 RepID=A0A7H0YH11_9BACL|nr:hypothetical protein [Paenibacillus peoriae]QNR70369.1 hypothetical protein IAQ67_28860 [Paenibacillus peoriae]
MKKRKGILIAGLLALALALTGCKGSFDLKDAVVVAKPTPPSFRSPGIITVMKDGSRYSLRVYQGDFSLVEIGAHVDVSYSGATESAELTPAVK